MTKAKQTTKAPTKPGYYWGHRPNEREWWMVQLAIDENNELRALRPGWGGYSWALDSFTHWVGPFPEPEPPTP